MQYNLPFRLARNRPYVINITVVQNYIGYICSNESFCKYTIYLYHSTDSNSVGQSR